MPETEKSNWSHLDGKLCLVQLEIQVPIAQPGTLEPITIGHTTPKELQLKMSESCKTDDEKEALYQRLASPFLGGMFAAVVHVHGSVLEFESRPIEGYVHRLSLHEKDVFSLQYIEEARIQRVEPAIVMPNGVS